MFKPLSLFMSLRYLRAKRRNHFISFISFVSMFGIALGVMVLITVMSVMNGFDQQIEQRIFSMIPPLTINGMNGRVDHWQLLSSQIQTKPEVKSIAPFIQNQVLLSAGQDVQPALLNGILPLEEKKINVLSQKMLIGKLEDLSEPFSIILGSELAMRLNVMVGDRVLVMTPQFSISPIGMTPRLKPFKVVGIFKIGSGFGFDNSFCFVHLTAASKLFSMGNSVTGLHIQIRNVYQAPNLVKAWLPTLSNDLLLSSWADGQLGELYHVLGMEKTMMFFLLLLIVAVAAFNLVATLVMVVNDKEKDIAILRTLGATPTFILKVFMLQGILIASIGVLLGIIFGVTLASNVTQLVNHLEQLLHTKFLSADVYWVDFLPSRILWKDVLGVGSCAFLLAWLATIYPAWRASKLNPVESLRHE